MQRRDVSKVLKQYFRPLGRVHQDMTWIGAEINGENDTFVTDMVEELSLVL